MGDIAKASFEDLVRRLRVAGDKYNDLRCVLWHGLKLPWGDLSCEFGELFGFSTFRPSDPDDWFHAGYYRESSKPSSFNRHKLLSIDRINELNESAKPIQKTLVSLFDDAMWLASENGFAGIPGCEILNLERLHRSASTWLFLLFHAAWNCPSGSLLRAKRWYPKVLIARSRLRDNQCREVGFAEDRLAWQSDANRLRDEIAERNLKLTKEERESEWLLIYDEECSQQRKKVAAGEYMSILPLDPFTASVALLEMVTKHGSEEQTSPSKISSVNAEAMATEETASPATKLKPSEEKAYGQYRLATERKAEWDGSTAQAAYDWINENLLDEGESIPSYATWRRQMGAGKKHGDDLMNTPKASRANGKSIVRADEI